VNVEKIAILGSGPHAVVIADALLSEKKFNMISFYEKHEVVERLRERKRKVTKDLSFPIYSEQDLFRKDLHEERPLVVLGIGQEFIEVRERLGKLLRDLNFSLCTVIHPSSIIAISAILGEGVVIMPGCVLGPFARMGDHAVLNTGATVDHDCVIGDNTFIQPGAHLGGNVRVGKNTIIGIGASVKQGVKIGNGSIIGGGAFVNRDVSDKVVYAGVPARKLKDI